MLHWIDAGHGEELTYNVWEGNRVVSRAVEKPTRAEVPAGRAGLDQFGATVPIDIRQNRARSRARFAEPGLGGHIRERFISIVMEETVPPNTGES